MDADVLVVGRAARRASSAIRRGGRERCASLLRRRRPALEPPAPDNPRGRRRQTPKAESARAYVESPDVTSAHAHLDQSNVDALPRRRDSVVIAPGQLRRASSTTPACSGTSCSVTPPSTASRARPSRPPDSACYRCLFLEYFGGITILTARRLARFGVSRDDGCAGHRVRGRTRRRRPYRRAPAVLRRRGDVLRG